MCLFFEKMLKEIKKKKSPSAMQWSVCVYFQNVRSVTESVRLVYEEYIYNFITSRCMSVLCVYRIYCIMYFSLGFRRTRVPLLIFFLLFLLFSILFLLLHFSFFAFAHMLDT